MSVIKNRLRPKERVYDGYLDNRTKKSKMRVVVSGRSVEVYKYEKPFIYNRGVQKRKAHIVALDQAPKSRRLDNLYRTRQKIKRIITANVTAYKCKPIFVTFTFAENITDPSQANPLWTKFTMRFNYFLLGKGLQPAKYLSVVEFQKRGAVHYHVIYFNLPYIPNIKEVVQNLWKQGFVKINAIDNVRFVGAYVSKYLQKGLSDERLRSRRAYFCSRHLQRPKIARDEHFCVDFLANNGTLELVDNVQFKSDRYGLIDYSIYKQN